MNLSTPILVTGAFGFIGQRLLKRFAKNGVEAIAFDLPNAKPQFPLPAHITHLTGDITNPNDVQRAVANAKSIIHLAAVVGDWGGAELHQRVTVDGTRLLFEAALASPHQLRVLLASSIVVYGHQIGLGSTPESLPHGRPFGPYSRSKQAQEKLAQRFATQGLPITTLRLANVYGAGSKLWVNELCRELKRGTPALLGGGNFNAGLVHVENVVEMICAALSNNAAIGQTFNVADEAPLTWREYTTELATLVNAPVPRSIPRWLAGLVAVGGEAIFGLLRQSRRPPLTREALNLVGSAHHHPIDKAKELLGYETAVSLEQGLQEVRDYLTNIRNY
mgnify:CR=1 FL=1